MEDDRKKVDEPLDGANKPDMDRRNFLSKAGKMVIPTLGILGLSLTVLPRGAAAADCYGGCKGGCEFVCGGCDGTCKGGCEGHMWK